MWLHSLSAGENLPHRNSEEYLRQKELLLTYLDKSFDERKVNFENFFNRLDKAMAQNDVEQMSIILSSINQLAAISPFKVLQARKDARRALEDPNFELDV